MRTVGLLNLELLITQLVNAQRLANEAAQKLKQREETNRAVIDDLETEYQRLMEEIASATQRQGEGIIEKIENLRRNLLIRPASECIREGKG